jgi:hypothetical protein
MGARSSGPRAGLRPIVIKGYRMMIEDGHMLTGRRIETEACGACGLIHFWDPKPSSDS